MVSKEIIEEAAKRGIVPGAVIRCLANSDDIATVPETSEWLIGDGDLYFETSGPIIVIRYRNGPFATVITPAPSSETLDPGMATKCGPAMRAAIMERAKELGLMDPSLKEKDNTEGIWVLDFSLQKGMLHTCTVVNSRGLTVIPAPEFLRRLENTKPPKRELTTEEKLAEAVRLLDRVTTDHENLMKACGHYTTPEDFTHTGAARAFLKSIKL